MSTMIMIWPTHYVPCVILLLGSVPVFILQIQIPRQRHGVVNYRNKSIFSYLFIILHSRGQCKLEFIMGLINRLICNISGLIHFFLLFACFLLSHLTTPQVALLLSEIFHFLK